MIQVSEQEVKEFYAMRPEWLSDQERAEFAAQNPDLVERFSDCWDGFTEGVKQEAAAQA